MEESFCWVCVGGERTFVRNKVFLLVRGGRRRVRGLGGVR